MKFLALIALLLLSPLLAAQSDSSFFFIQLADPQFGMYPTGKDFSHERENVSKAVKAINRLKPEFVVVCGDLVNSEGDLKQIAAFREEFGKIDKSIPLYLVAGNHDVENTPTDSSLLHYRNEFGPDYYTFERRGVRFIVINSSLIMDPAKVPEEARKQEDWLRVQLTNHHSPRTLFERPPQRLAHPLDLRLFHHPRERQRQAASPEILGDGEVSLLIAKLLPHVALQVDRREVRPSRDTVRLHLLRNAVPPEFSVEAHHIDEPAHAGRRRGLWDRPRPAQFRQALPIPVRHALALGKQLLDAPHLGQAQRSAQLVQAVVVAEVGVFQPGVSRRSTLIA